MLLSESSRSLHTRVPLGSKKITRTQKVQRNLHPEPNRSELLSKMIEPYPYLPEKFEPGAEEEPRDVGPDPYRTVKYWTQTRPKPEAPKYPNANCTVTSCQELNKLVVVKLT